MNLCDVQKTQEMLNSEALRKEAIKEDKSAKAWDQHVQQMAGSKENSEDIYKIASEVFGDLTKNSGGDSLKMIEL